MHASGWSIIGKKNHDKVFADKMIMRCFQIKMVMIMTIIYLQTIIIINMTIIYLHKIMKMTTFII